MSDLAAAPGGAARAAARPGPAPFAPWHPWDRVFAPALVAAIWFGVLMGFVPEIWRHFARHRPAYPLIVHLHAAAFVGWLVLLTTQVSLIRTGRTAVHRRLGQGAVLLWLAMIVLGPVTAFVVDRIQLSRPHPDPAFLILQLLDMVNFGVITGAGLALRADPAAHRRLMLLGTVFISDAGFGRWLGDGLQKALGDGFWPFMVAMFLGDLVLVGAMLGYDLITRRRLHGAATAAAAFGVANQAVVCWLYYAPWWKALATSWITAW